MPARPFFFDQRYLTAARTDRAPDRVYRNWDAPRLDAGGYYLSRSGDDGLTRLDQLVLPGRFSLPLFRGAELTLSYQARRLDAGSGPETPYAGRYYRYINNPAARTDRLIETRWVHLTPSRPSDRRTGGLSPGRLDHPPQRPDRPDGRL